MPVLRGNAAGLVIGVGMTTAKKKWVSIVKTASTFPLEGLFINTHKRAYFEFRYYLRVVFSPFFNHLQTRIHTPS
jgi:hypothetical protein